MRVVGKAGREDVAVVYLGEVRGGELIEFVESTQPPVPREQKWVLIVSTLLGCPVNCPMCDAGGWYRGKLSAEEILAQIDYMVTARFPDRRVTVGKFKVQFARMGEPALNPHVLDVLEELPGRYQAPGLTPSLSTVAPEGAGRFFDRLLDITRRHYGSGNFQLQFSVHTTDTVMRDSLIPVRKWDFSRIAEYGSRFCSGDGRKITLNFALARNSPLDPAVLREHFDPRLFLIKLTPVNPTIRALENRIESVIQPDSEDSVSRVVDSLESVGYEVIVSIGQWEENRIGSNCGQFIRRFLELGGQPQTSSYHYSVVGQS